MKSPEIDGCPQCRQNVKHVHPIEPSPEASTAHPIFGEVIHSYSRREAIEDGVLVDASAMAKEAGFKYPLALTRTVWDRYVTPAEGLVGYGQSVEGRLWDVLMMLRYAIRRHGGGSRLMFEVLFRMPDRDDWQANERTFREDGRTDRTMREVTLKSLIGPGDTPEPVLTIMLPDED